MSFRDWLPDCLKDIDIIAEFILYDHEYWNGEGYPHGLKGEDIPLISERVIDNIYLL